MWPDSGTTTTNTSNTTAGPSFTDRKVLHYMNIAEYSTMTVTPAQSAGTHG